MTKQERDFAQMYRSLKRILGYMTPGQIRRRGQKVYGLPPEEVLEMAYENILQEAKDGLKGVRLSKVAKPSENPAA